MVVAKADLLYYAHEYSQAHALTKQVLDKDPYHKVRSQGQPCAVPLPVSTAQYQRALRRPRGVWWAS